MTPIDALLLGIIEGLTEFLPVSSTGHLILLGERLAGQGEAAKTLEIVIQAGAVLAVVIHYRARLWQLTLGILRRQQAELRLLTALLIAFIPAAGVGFFVHKIITDLLFWGLPVAGALIVGGIVMLVTERWRKHRPEPAQDGLEHVTPERAMLIGFAQCFSLWPGASRSMTTILGGQLTGLSTATAAEFSFLLAIPTLGAATAYDLLKHGKELLAAEGGATSLAIGLGVSFVVAWAVVAAFLRYLRRFGLVPFGIYRIALGAVVIAVYMMGGARGEADAGPDAAAAPTSTHGVSPDR